jgi:CheY-like chemotaxis protein
MTSATAGGTGSDPAPQLLFVEPDPLDRTAIAGYLRECGYHVIEAVSAEEAQAVLAERAAEIDIAFIAVDLPGGMDGFALANAIRERAAGIRVLLVGTLAKAAKLAGELCERGPHLRKPYEPQALVDWIKRLRIPKTE